MIKKLLLFRLFRSRVKLIFNDLLLNSLRENLLTAYIEGNYRCEYFIGKVKHVEIITIRLRGELTGIYSINCVDTRLESHNEQMVFSKSNSEWVFAFNSTSMQLFEIGGINVISFIPEENVLFLNSRPYSKILLKSSDKEIIGVI